MSPPDYATARGLMIGAAITAVIWYGFWLPTTDEPIWTKSLIGAFVGIIALGGLPWGIDWISRIQARKLQLLQSAPALFIDCSIATNNNTRKRATIYG
jgi:hypothetical protein